MAEKSVKTFNLPFMESMSHSTIKGSINLLLKEKNNYAIAIAFPLKCLSIIFLLCEVDCSSRTRSSQVTTSKSRKTTQVEQIPSVERCGV